MILNRDNLFSLAGEIAQGSQLLIDQELNVLSVEMHREWKEMKRGLPYLFLAACAALVVAVFTSISFAQWLTLHRGLPLWSAYGLVGALAFFLGLIFLVIGRSHIKAASMVPKEGIRSIKENLQCLIN